MNITELSPKQLRTAAQIKEKIASLEKELASILGCKASAPSTPAQPAKRKISAAGIARIKAAQKARWAKVKAAKKA